MNLFGKVFEEELLSSILLTCQLTCYDRQTHNIELIRTSSSELDVQHNEEELCDYIFGSMHKIFTMLSNIELSICDSMRRSSAQ